MIPQNRLPNVPRYTYDEMRPLIKSGDILLCSGKHVFSRLIKIATKSIWSHVGFVMHLDDIDRIMVLESIESIGVRTIPLSSYVNDYNGTGKSYPGNMVIARHADFKEGSFDILGKYAVDKFGYPYDYKDIARIAGRLALRMIGIHHHYKILDSSKAFICSEYAQRCYQQVGIDIPYDKSGFITPNDFAKDRKINAVGILERKR